jgi:thymidylate kinase
MRVLARRGAIVAVVGPDGAGKSTLVSRLPETLGHPSVVVYMGVNPESTTHSLPTMRWAQRRGVAGGLLPAAAARRLPAAPARRSGAVLAELRAAITFTHRLADLGFRFAVGWRASRGGAVVIFDRYVYDARIDTLLDSQPLSARLYGRLAMALFPDPDLLIVLDAPSELLFERKREHPVERLDRLRAAYKSLAGGVPSSTMIDAGQPADDVLRATADTIRKHLAGDAP